MPDHPHDSQPLDDHPDLLPPEDPEQVRRARLEAASELYAQERRDLQAEEDMYYMELLAHRADIAALRGDMNPKILPPRSRARRRRHPPTPACRPLS